MTICRDFVVCIRLQIIFYPPNALNPSMFNFSLNIGSLIKMFSLLKIRSHLCTALSSRYFLCLDSLWDKSVIVLFECYFFTFLRSRQRMYFEVFFGITERAATPLAVPFFNSFRALYFILYDLFSVFRFDFATDAMFYNLILSYRWNSKTFVKSIPVFVKQH